MIAAPPTIVLPYVFDLELSGKCNTVCTFCPRDEMKRGEQFMSDVDFEHFLDKFGRYVKALEDREVVLPHEKARGTFGKREQSAARVILCGMGESLMHPRCPEWISRIRREVGVRVTVVTNGLLLKESLVEKLAEAQITVILVSVPGIDRETYTRYIPLDWDRVLANIVRTHARLPGRVHINATIPDDSPLNQGQVLNFWRARDIPVMSINHCHNRGGFLHDGALTGKHGDSDSHFCGIIARHNFIAWDGRILSCCHDLHAENVLGHVSDVDFLDLAMRNTRVVDEGPAYRICRECNDCERNQRVQIVRIQPDDDLFSTRRMNLPVTNSVF
jgi:Radical SAM superfamily/Iron-sulfur cluster-binding domain